MIKPFNVPSEKTIQSSAEPIHIYYEVHSGKLVLRLNCGICSLGYKFIGYL